MNKERQTGLAQFLGHPQTFRRAKFRRKCLFEIDLAAASYEAGYAFGDNRRESPVPGPSAAQLFGTNERVILVVRMTDVAWGLRHPQSVVLREPLRQNRGVTAPDFYHPGKFAQQGASERRLKFGQAPVGPKRFMEPAKARRMLTIVDSLVALAVILVAPGLLPDGFVI